MKTMRFLHVDGDITGVGTSLDLETTHLSNNDFRRLERAWVELVQNAQKERQANAPQNLQHGIMSGPFDKSTTSLPPNDATRDNAPIDARRVSYQFPPQQTPNSTAAPAPAPPPKLDDPNHQTHQQPLTPKAKKKGSMRRNPSSSKLKRSKSPKHGSGGGNKPLNSNSDPGSQSTQQPTTLPSASGSNVLSSEGGHESSYLSVQTTADDHNEVESEGDYSPEDHLDDDDHDDNDHHQGDTTDEPLIPVDQIEEGIMPTPPTHAPSKPLRPHANAPPQKLVMAGVVFKMGDKGKAVPQEAAETERVDKLSFFSLPITDVIDKEFVGVTITRDVLAASQPNVTFAPSIHKTHDTITFHEFLSIILPNVAKWDLERHFINYIPEDQLLLLKGSLCTPKYGLMPKFPKKAVQAKSFEGLTARCGGRMTLDILGSNNYQIGNMTMTEEMWQVTAARHCQPPARFHATFYDCLRTLFPQVPLALMKSYEVIYLTDKHVDLLRELFIVENPGCVEVAGAVEAAKAALNKERELPPLIHGPGASGVPELSFKEFALHPSAQQSLSLSDYKEICFENKGYFELIPTIELTYHRFVAIESQHGGFGKITMLQAAQFCFPNIHKEQMENFLDHLDALEYNEFAERLYTKKDPSVGGPLKSPFFAMNDELRDDPEVVNPKWEVALPPLPQEPAPPLPAADLLTSPSKRFDDGDRLDGVSPLSQKSGGSDEKQQQAQETSIIEDQNEQSQVSAVGAKRKMTRLERGFYTDQNPNELKWFVNAEIDSDADSDTIQQMMKDMGMMVQNASPKKANDNNKPKKKVFRKRRTANDDEFQLRPISVTPEEERKKRRIADKKTLVQKIRQQITMHQQEMIRKRREANLARRMADKKYAEQMRKKMAGHDDSSSDDGMNITFSPGANKNQSHDVFASARAVVKTALSKVRGEAFDASVSRPLYNSPHRQRKPIDKPLRIKVQPREPEPPRAAQSAREPKPKMTARDRRKKRQEQEQLELPKIQKAKPPPPKKVPKKPLALSPFVTKKKPPPTPEPEIPSFKPKKAKVAKDAQSIYSQAPTKKPAPPVASSMGVASSSVNPGFSPTGKPPRPRGSAGQRGDGTKTSSPSNSNRPSRPGSSSIAGANASSSTPKNQPIRTGATPATPVTAPPAPPTPG